MVGVLGLCWLPRDVPFARQWRPVAGVPRLCWLLRGSFEGLRCPRTSAALRSSTTCLAAFPCAQSPGAPTPHPEWCPVVKRSLWGGGGGTRGGGGGAPPQVVRPSNPSRGTGGDLGGEALEILRQVHGPEHREVRLRGAPEVVQRVQEPERRLGDHVLQAPVHGLEHAPEGGGHPRWVPGEQFRVGGGAQVADHPHLDDELVDEFLEP